jgi:hypothetical protein
MQEKLYLLLIKLQAARKVRIYLFVIYLTMLSVAQTTERRMIG